MPYPNMAVSSPCSDINCSREPYQSAILTQTTRTTLFLATRLPLAPREGLITYYWAVVALALSGLCRRLWHDAVGRRVTGRLANTADTTLAESRVCPVTLFMTGHGGSDGHGGGNQNENTLMGMNKGVFFCDDGHRSVGEGITFFRCVSLLLIHRINALLTWAHNTYTDVKQSRAQRCDTAYVYLCGPRKQHRRAAGECRKCASENKKRFKTLWT